MMLKSCKAVVEDGDNDEDDNYTTPVRFSVFSGKANSRFQTWTAFI